MTGQNGTVLMLLLNSCVRRGKSMVWQIVQYRDFPVIFRLFPSFSENFHCDELCIRLSTENSSLSFRPRRMTWKCNICIRYQLCFQVCDIGDASKGSLSSYAYILMLLHYLQQCQPPVIPVLQTLHTDNKPPEKIIDGWNCWFLSDLKKIVGGRALEGVFMSCENSYRCEFTPV